MKHAKIIVSTFLTMKATILDTHCIIEVTIFCSLQLILKMKTINKDSKVTINLISNFVNILGLKKPPFSTQCVYRAYNLLCRYFILFQELLMELQWVVYTLVSLYRALIERLSPAR